jgi:hypothetical protein
MKQENGSWAQIAIDYENGTEGSIEEAWIGRL